MWPLIGHKQVGIVYLVVVSSSNPTTNLVELCSLSAQGEQGNFLPDTPPPPPPYIHKKKIEPQRTGQSTAWKTRYACAFQIETQSPDLDEV